jgi:hypothetical protein
MTARTLLALALLVCCALATLAAHAGYPDYHVGAVCDGALRRAVIHSDEVRQGAQDFTSDDLPDHQKNQKPTTVCDFGPDML